MTDPSPADDYAANIAAFKKVQPDYQVLGEIVEAVLKRATRELGITAIVQARVKQLASFAEKTIRKQASYRDPVNTMTDLCGARVITESIDGIAPVCAFIRRHFLIDEANSEDTVARLSVAEFGYRSVHFIVSLKPGELRDDIAAYLARHPNAEAIIERLFERRTPEDWAEKSAKPGPRYRMEIQVRSLLQHAWATMYHDRVYKSAFNLPADLKRELIRIAAVLEDADASFARAIAKVDGYREYYGTYLPREQMSDELAKDQQVLEHDSDNLPLALKAARLAVSLERWPDVVRILKPFVSHWESTPVDERGERLLRVDALNAALKAEETAKTPTEHRHARAALDDLRDPHAMNLLLDYGIANWRLGDKDTARHCLRLAAGLDLTSADAIIALADTWDEERSGKALDLYRKAFEIDPEEPRAVRGFLQLTAEHDHNLNVVAPMRPTLHKAIKRCRERATLGIYLPWAYYDIGCFSLMLDQPFDGIAAYARAVELSHSVSVIDGVLKRARRLGEGLHADETSEWPMLERFLLLARVVKLETLAQDAARAVNDKQKKLSDAESALRKAKADDTRSALDVQDLERKAEAAHKALGQAKKEAAQRRSQAENAQKRLVPLVADPACPDFTGGNKTGGPAQGQSGAPIDAEVVIVAGGSAQGETGHLSEYRPLLEAAFKDFKGAIFSGGTCSGIGQIVGDLPDSSHGPILKIACLPEYTPSNHRQHEAYILYNHPGSGFSALGAIQVWADILSQGIAASSVRVIGIGGGNLAGLEYRLGLMMGAKVGVLTGSGRAAQAILEDPDWKDHPNLIVLPNDPQTVKLFLDRPSSGGILTPAQREAAARAEHERNAEARCRKAGLDQDQNQPWDKLRDDLKELIRNRVDFGVEQLRAVGLRIVPVAEVPDGVTPVETLTEDQVEIMAEMEHGRWCVEKLLDGWRLSDRKDEPAKLHPDLIPWENLSAPTRDKDRHYARRVPAVLKEQGFAVVPLETSA